MFLFGHNAALKAARLAQHGSNKPARCSPQLGAHCSNCCVDLVLLPSAQAMITSVWEMTGPHCFSIPATHQLSDSACVKPSVPHPSTYPARNQTGWPSLSREHQTRRCRSSGGWRSLPELRPLSHRGPLGPENSGATGVWSGEEKEGTLSEERITSGKWLTCCLLYQREEKNKTVIQTDMWLISGSLLMTNASWQHWPPTCDMKWEHQQLLFCLLHVHNI